MSGLRRLLTHRGRRGRDRRDLRVDDAMTAEAVAVTPDDGVRTAARRMAENETVAVVVEGDRPGIMTARDVLEFVAAGRDGERERVEDHCTSPAASTPPDAPLDDAVTKMVDGGFRHLVVRAEGRIAGVLAMRDVVRTWVDEGAAPREPVPIRTAMNTDFVAADGDESVQRSAAVMTGRNAAVAVVAPSAGRSYPGLFTEREVVAVLAAGKDLDSARIADHLAPKLTFSAPGWSVKQAAEAMRSGGFQYVVVVDQHEVRGVIAIRDIVRAWIDAER